MRMPLTHVVCSAEHLCWAHPFDTLYINLVVIVVKPCSSVDMQESFQGYQSDYQRCQLA